MRVRPTWVLVTAILAVVGFALYNARGDAEYVRHLDATFAVQADGTMDVRYELDWHFARFGQHGIDFGIVTREKWDADPSLDAVYTVDITRVDSPSASSRFEESTHRDGPWEILNLRIGDPERNNFSKDHTYVIEYTLGGALRTFDGTPQLFWDVTGPG